MRKMFGGSQKISHPEAPRVLRDAPHPEEAAKRPSRRALLSMRARPRRTHRVAPLIVIDALSAAARVEQFVEAEQAEILGPRLWAIKIALEIRPRTLFGVSPYLRGIEVEMLEQRLVETVAFVRRAAERHLDDGLDH